MPSKSSTTHLNRALHSLCNNAFALTKNTWISIDCFNFMCCVWWKRKISAHFTSRSNPTKKVNCCFKSFTNHACAHNSSKIQSNRELWWRLMYIKKHTFAYCLLSFIYMACSSLVLYLVFLLAITTTTTTAAARQQYRRNNRIRANMTK